MRTKCLIHKNNTNQKKFFAKNVIFYTKNDIINFFSYEKKIQQSYEIDQLIKQHMLILKIQS